MSAWVEATTRAVQALQAPQAPQALRTVTISVSSASWSRARRE